ncbi:MAG TPA: peptidase [Gammaproteobacteria bacterium]|nr:peptidase [Gammaproteobacteria bacterium]
MHWLILLGLAIVVIAGPQWWVSQTLKRHSHPRNDLAGSGGELASHLIERLKLSEVTVQGDAHADHYNPLEKTVCLTPAIANQTSLTAIVVAAHEVGHALQDATSYPPLRLRTRLAQLCTALEKSGSILLVAIPVVMLITRIPQTGAMMLLLVVASVLAGVLLNIVTLPVEFDASFGRALPILEQGEYLSPEDIPAARQILTACALTYVAASLLSMVNAWRWLRYRR